MCRSFRSCEGQRLIRRRSPCACAAGPEDFQGMGDVDKTVLLGNPVGPALNRRPVDLDGRAALTAYQVVVMAGAATPVEDFALVVAQGVELGLGIGDEPELDPVQVGPWAPVVVVPDQGDGLARRELGDPERPPDGMFSGCLANPRFQPPGCRRT